jgi:hypothetical protein
MQSETNHPGFVPVMYVNPIYAAAYSAAYSAALAASLQQQAGVSPATSHLPFLPYHFPPMMYNLPPQVSRQESLRLRTWEKQVDEPPLN